MSFKRSKFSKKASKRNFTKHAKRVHGRNGRVPMRGGIRA